jgi:DNA replication protein DnaC
MSSDLEPLLKRLHLANTRRVWRDLCQRAEKEEWSYEAFLHTLFAEEVAHRRGTRLARAVRTATFPFLRTIDEFDFSYQSTLRLTTMGSLLTPDFVTEGRSLILEGKPGRGKTHLAIAIAYRALQNDFDALFITAAQLIETLSLASREGKLQDALARFMKPHVLVVDEVGYLAYGDDAANVLYHVVNDRHIRGRSMIFTTNKHPRRWGDVLHDDDLADAIVDRILERGRLLRLDGPSLRTKHLPESELRLDDREQTGGRRISGTGVAEFPEPTSGTCFEHGGIYGACRKEGEQREGKVICGRCCDGLESVDDLVVGDAIPPELDSLPEGCDRSPAPESLLTCIRCGDSVCGAGENWCNCPKDCPK